MPTNVRRVKLSLSQVLFDMSVYDDLTLKSMAVQQSNLEIVQKIQSASIDFANVFYLIAKQQYLLRELGAQKEMYQTLLAEMNSKQLLKLVTIDDTLIMSLIITIPLIRKF